MEFSHKPIMVRQVIEGLDIKSGGLYVDGTAGGGGHSEEILKADGTVRLIAIDKDTEALEHCKKRLKRFEGRVTFIHGDFKDIKSFVEDESIDGALLDLGVSSYQLDNFERGFSYRSGDFPLDMRMDRNQPFSAYDVVNGYDERRLAKVIREYGEERFAFQIARNIVKRRSLAPIRSCGELSEIIYESIPAPARRTGGNPSRRTFQAIRIEVNGELDSLKALYDFVNALKSGGRLCVITFHSLEDRIVKNVFNELARCCICPPKAPICVCGNKPKIEKITKKPITPDPQETEENPRAGSAKLRICQKI